MRILLINPPIEDFYTTIPRLYPLGLLYIGTVLKESGFEVKILDCLRTEHKITLAYPRQFSYLKRYYHINKSPFSLFSQYYRFGLEDKEIVGIIKDFSPHIVGISANFSCYIDTSIHLSRIIKNIDKNIIVVLGGQGATALAEIILKNNSVDFILRGEAEYTFLEFCRKIERSYKIEKIEGLCYRKVNGDIHISRKIACIDNLESLPLPDRTLIEYNKYKFHGLIYTFLLASRGCPLKCGFCGIIRRYRYRTPQNILAEISVCYNLGIRHFNFEDDNINFHPGWEEIIDMIIDRFPDIKISFMNGILSSRIKGSLKRKLIKANLTHLDLSLVSSDDNLIKKMGRRESKRNIFYISKFMAKNNIPVTIHFIVGLPYQDIEHLIKDIRLLAQEPVYLGPSIFYPVVGSGLFKYLQKRFNIDKRDYILFRSSCASPVGKLSRDEIFSIFYVSRIINFIKRNIDTKLWEGNLEKILEKELDGIFDDNGLISTEKELDKDQIGVFLLKKLLKEKNIYRVEERGRNNLFVYTLKREDFVPPYFINKVFDNLKIKSINYREVFLEH